METKWTIDSDQSDVLIKIKHSIVAYIAGTTNNFKGNVDLKDDHIENANIEFSLDVNNKENKLEQIDTFLRINDFIETERYPIINFKSTSFQKVNQNINFLKGNLTVKNITKVIELDTAFLGYNFYNGVRKASFEVKGTINRNDFDLKTNSIFQKDGIMMGQDLLIEANLEFTA
ncbi:polyisoprenoid-binding protein [Flavobacterium faecale]|uniref:Polyisoprenoid-binding protein n=1 Tax=Flavobacterium faecale TaxID=1355330 RepID=A0A2S1LA36_9FLAO|nr:YceI family protein [Flavobacterium faecale]AWG20587.1 polyisoprenoid-binding protein [Flavobacterium faecale]